jgi:hypothetical protein
MKVLLSKAGKKVPIKFFKAKFVFGDGKSSSKANILENRSIHLLRIISASHLNIFSPPVKKCVYSRKSHLKKKNVTKTW